MLAAALQSGPPRHCGTCSTATAQGSARVPVQRALIPQFQACYISLRCCAGPGRLLDQPHELRAARGAHRAQRQPGAGAAGGAPGGHWGSVARHARCAGGHNAQAAASKRAPAADGSGGGSLVSPRADHAAPAAQSRPAWKRGGARMGPGCDRGRAGAGRGPEGVATGWGSSLRFGSGAAARAPRALRRKGPPRRRAPRPGQLPRARRTSKDILIPYPLDAAGQGPQSPRMEAVTRSLKTS